MYAFGVMLLHLVDRAASFDDRVFRASLEELSVRPFMRMFRSDLAGWVCVGNEFQEEERVRAEADPRTPP